MQIGKSILTGALALAGGAVLAGQVFAANGLATGDTSTKRIAFSNSYAGNSFRQIMIKDFERMAQKAVDEGKIAGFTTVSANNNVTEQAGQIQNLILQGYDAIIVLAGSDTALNGAIKEACGAGITVVAFASGVTEPCVHTVDYNLDSYAKAELDFVQSKLGYGPANILEIRGMAGDGFDKRLHEGVVKAMAEHPNYKSVGEVYGQWTGTVAQKEVAGILPSLKKVDAVLTQGGDGYGAMQAFKAAGRDIPIIIMGNRQDELQAWKDQHIATGYETFSLGATPSVSQVAFWTAQQILAGKKVPDFVEVPLLEVHQADLDAWLKVVPEGGVLDADYDQKIVGQIIDANIAGTELPSVAAPN
ncbi:monosaccharide ABC transporter substrate-binding protein (CUT2 family) [Breoghania corrubedonensis]|uniref:Monosaccharide ABC transporter substrate-binding protein (CUT2 family) n=1 Tax=Breoghania corrubedonensis TaxID=665038 RepID=A0A2T5V5F3_9HYPH|nr:ABC transporter substrate-binding protein [Breoghania corrubedonensis]PTW58975.1 monosaccharide ABC transporter substrate-binding protein (CUT2 family) [Breoghania corrubedonensis]